MVGVTATFRVGIVNRCQRIDETENVCHPLWCRRVTTVEGFSFMLHLQYILKSFIIIVVCLECLWCKRFEPVLLFTTFFVRIIAGPGILTSGFYAATALEIQTRKESYRSITSMRNSIERLPPGTIDYIRSGVNILSPSMAIEASMSDEWNV